MGPRFFCIDNEEGVVKYGCRDFATARYGAHGRTLLVACLYASRNLNFWPKNPRYRLFDPAICATFCVPPLVRFRAMTFTPTTLHDPRNPSTACWWKHDRSPGSSPSRGMQRLILYELNHSQHLVAFDSRLSALHSSCMSIPRD